MLPAEGQVVTTTSTVTESTVRGRRIRLFITGFLQLIFGGFSLIPVLLLAQNPVTITACAWLSLTGMVGILGACVSSNKTSTSVKYDAVTRTQRVVTVPPMFPRFYVGMMVVGFIIGKIVLLYLKLSGQEGMFRKGRGTKSKKGSAPCLSYRPSLP